MIGRGGRGAPPRLEARRAQGPEDISSTPTRTQPQRQIASINAAGEKVVPEWTENAEDMEVEPSGTAPPMAV